MNSLAERCVRATYALSRVDQNGQRTAVASCFQVAYRSKFLLMTVAHAVCDAPDGEFWIFERGVGPMDIGMSRIPSMIFAKNIQNSLCLATNDLLQYEDGDLDFAFLVMNSPQPFMVVENITDGQSLPELRSIERCAVELEFAETLSTSNRYGFYGLVRGWHDGRNFFRSPQVEVDMQYHRINSNGVIEFRTARIMRSDDDYRGCSGAPILDEAGRLSSIVIGGCAKEDLIYGLHLNSTVQAAIDTAMQNCQSQRKSQ